MEARDHKYFHSDIVHNLASPSEIVPFIMQLINPSSVADVGCGTGTFLKVFKEHGVKKVLGIDGPLVNRDKMHIDISEFIEADLEKPLKINGFFDLILCLEVAEHLSADSADTLVSSLVSLGKIICFSAAVTMQGGQNHINEQPISYWQKKFRNYKYQFFDVFRNEFWDNEIIDWWYKQNMFLIVHESINVSDIIAYRQLHGDAKLHIHPDLLRLHIQQKENALLKIQYLKNNLHRIKSGEEIWKLYGSILLKKIRKVFK